MSKFNVNSLVKEEFSAEDKQILQNVMQEEKDRRIEEKRIAKEKQESEMKKQKPIESYVIKYRSIKERLSEVSHGRAAPKVRNNPQSQF